MTDMLLPVAGKQIKAGSAEINDGYFIQDGERSDLEKKLIENIKDSGAPDPGVYAVWLEHDNPYADIVRSHEYERFPEIPEIVKEYEHLCEFLALVDTREGNEGLVHGFRVSGKGEAKDVDHTGLPFIDQIIDSRQGLTAVRFTNFYASRGTNLDHHARSVETNFRIKKAERVNGVPIPQLAYLSLFNHLDDELAVDEGVLFAHLNTPAKLSLHGVGVEYDDIAGVEGLMTPTLEGNGLITFDKKYNPVAIGATEKNLGIFRQLSAVAIPPISLAS